MRTDDKSYGPFEIGLRLAATERELAETRRQLDEEQRKNIYLELDLEEERSIFEATNNGAKQCAEERDKLRRQRDLLLDAAKKLEEVDGPNAARFRRLAKHQKGSSSLSDAMLALYDAICECEPPKPTREELYKKLRGDAEEALRVMRATTATEPCGADCNCWDASAAELEGTLVALDALDGGGQ